MAVLLRPLPPVKATSPLYNELPTPITISTTAGLLRGVARKASSAGRTDLLFPSQSRACSPAKLLYFTATAAAVVYQERLHVLVSHAAKSRKARILYVSLPFHESKC